MIKVFLDANVLFSAVNSSTGGSAYIIGLAKKSKLNLCSSILAIKEAERNLREKASEDVVLEFYDLLDEIEFELFDVNRLRAKKKFGNLIGEKDAPILASAIDSKAEFLVTLDKKHFLNQKVLKAKLPVKIVTPGDLIQKYL